MTNLFEILTSAAEGKMAAVYKKKANDKNHMVLLKGLIYSSDNLNCTANGNIISLTDNENPEAAPLNIDTEHIDILEYKARKDKYGAQSVKFNIADENYIIQFA